MAEYHAHKAGPLHRPTPTTVPTNQPSDPEPTPASEPDGNHPVIQTTEVNGDGGVPGTGVR